MFIYCNIGINVCLDCNVSNIAAIFGPRIESGSRIWSGQGGQRMQKGVI